MYICILYRLILRKIAINRLNRSITQATDEAIVSKLLKNMKNRLLN